MRIIRKVVAASYASAEGLRLVAAVTHDYVGVATGAIALVRGEFLVVRPPAREHGASVHLLYLMILSK